MNNNEIKVTILCTVYNHEKYLRKCLDGFVKQKTNFKFEALVHDDCSTDNSKKIIEEYHKKFPNIIIPIFEKENQYSQGIRINIDILMPMIKGKYFTFCEGDDYWIDENKLQKQYNFMEDNEDYSLCVHNAFIVDKNENIIGKINPVKKDANLFCDEFIKCGGGFIATNSIFSRTNFTRELPEYFNDFSLDYIWQIYLSSQGKTFCFNDYMSAYRKGVEESWTQRISKDIDKTHQFLKKLNNKLVEINKITNSKYKDSIEIAIAKNKLFYYELIGNYSDFNKEPYRTIIRQYPLKKRLKVFLKSKLNWGYKVYKKIKTKRK